MQDNLKPAAGAFAKVSNEAAEFGRGNLEAVVQSAQAYLTGMQDLGRQYVAVVQGLTQHVIEDAKGFADVKNLQGAMVLQASLARGSVERALGEGAKLQQAAIVLAEQVHAPLTRRAAAAIEQTKLARAA
jgi:phasin family protein